MWSSSLQRKVFASKLVDYAGSFFESYEMYEEIGGDGFVCY